MISNGHKCVLVAVPKTGTTSMRAILGMSGKPHLSIAQIRAELSEVDFGSYYKFGFVRNPWDRAVSIYERREGIQMRSRMPFDEFIDWMRFASCTCIHPLPHRYQLDWFVDQNGEVIVDFIGRFERLREDWEEIASKISVGELPRMNVNQNRQRYTEYFTPRTREIVRERFAVDIEYFGYEFDE